MESLRWLNDWCLEGNNCHVEQLGQWELWTTLSTLLSFPMFQPLVFVAKTSLFYVSLISDNTRVGWRPDWWRRSCKKGKKRVDAVRNLKTSTGNPRGVRIWITFLSMTLRLWKSKWWLLRGWWWWRWWWWWLLRGGKVYELGDARWKFWLVDNFERRESKFSRNMAW